MSSSSSFSPYYDAEAIGGAVASGQHRELVGGMWEEIGTLQFEFLKAQGLAAQHRLLDIGCGSLRGGVHFVRYLDSGRYYGIDLNRTLLEAGYEREIAPAGLAAKLPRDNLRSDGDFDLECFGVTFDFALALSLFTHLPLNAIRICLERAAPVVAERGTLFATIFELPDDEASWRPRLQPPGLVTTHGARDPYHYRFGDLVHAAMGLPWSVRRLREFAHPRGQIMLAFDRV